MLLHLDKAITIYNLGDHYFKSKRGDKRTCSRCGEYWMHRNHHGAFDKSKEGKEALFFDEFIRNGFEKEINNCSLLSSQAI